MDEDHYIRTADIREIRDLEQAEWERDPDYKYYRTSPAAVHRHHRKRRPHCTPEEYTASWNILEVSPRLHRWIHDNVELSYARGWLVHSWDDPRHVPVEPHPELRIL